MSLHRVLALVFAGTAIAACTTATTVPPATPEAGSTSEPAMTAAPTATAESTAAPTATAAPTSTAQANAPVPEGATCTGRVDAPPKGLTASEEAAPSFAIGQPGKGALCEGKVFTAKEPVTVYRVFSADYATSKQAGPLGAYWTFAKPTGKQADYRATYEICTEWNKLDTLNECTVDVGAKIVLGPGQSATCDGGKEYAQSAANQVLIVKVDGKVPVSNCKQSPVKWAN